ncbi:MAG: calcium-binding protein [Pseudomonadota bacterium]
MPSADRDAAFMAAPAPAAQRGGPEADALFGGAERDALRGLGGGDRLHGLGGSDRLFGGDGEDRLQGGAGRDSLSGGPGADRLRGGAGTDRLDGGEGDDRLYGGGGRRDVLMGGAGDDLLSASGRGAAFLPGLGRDVVVAGAGDGALSYAGLDLAVRVDLALGVARGEGLRDSLVGIASVLGAAGDDRLRGGGGAEWEGFAGGPGADLIVGRGGYDAVLYHLENGPSGVQVDLEAGEARDSFGDRDRLRGIEEVSGTLLDDRLSGGAQPFESWRGFAGADRIDGRGGADRADYLRDAALGGKAGVRADLARGWARDGWGDRDRLIDIESLRGGPADDVMQGDDADNRLQGEGGDDRLEGRGGRDRIEGGEGDDRLLGGFGRDVFVHVSGDGSDRVFDFRPGRDKLRLEGQSAEALHELRWTDRPAGARLRLDDGERLRFDGLRAEDFSAEDVWLIEG